MRRKRFPHLRTALIAGLLLSAAAALLIWSAPHGAIVQQRERTLDALIQLRPVTVVPEIVVVDIDQQSESAAVGAPWSRARMATFSSIIALSSSRLMPP